MTSTLFNGQMRNRFGRGVKEQSHRAAGGHAGSAERALNWIQAAGGCGAGSADPGHCQPLGGAAVTPAMLQKREERADPLSGADELRAQYVACSYLSTACQDVLGRFPAPGAGDDDRIAQKALEYVLAIEWDWRQTLQGLAEQVARATACERPRRRREIARR